MIIGSEYEKLNTVILFLRFQVFSGTDKMKFDLRDSNLMGSKYLREKGLVREDLFSKSQGLAWVPECLILKGQCLHVE